MFCKPHRMDCSQIGREDNFLNKYPAETKKKCFLIDIVQSAHLHSRYQSYWEEMDLITVLMPEQKDFGLDSLYSSIAKKSSNCFWNSVKPTVSPSLYS